LSNPEVLAAVKIVLEQAFEDQLVMEGEEAKNDAPPEYISPQEQQLLNQYFDLQDLEIPEGFDPEQFGKLFKHGIAAYRSLPKQFKVIGKTLGNPENKDFLRVIFSTQVKLYEKGLTYKQIEKVYEKIRTQTTHLATPYSFKSQVDWTLRSPSTRKELGLD